MTVLRIDYNEVVAFLKSRGADRIPHIGGTLLPHLAGTCHLLRSWGDSAFLCLAGLCHTAYGTDGFPVPLCDLARRTELADLISPPAEQLVYFYASCDRSFLYPRIVDRQPARFRDRFTGAVFEPEPATYRDFLELTFANELDIFRRCGIDAQQTKDRWRSIMSPCQALVSEKAYACFLETLG
jgi:hypothetical protein